MLNVYQYYGTPETLPLYEPFGDIMKKVTLIMNNELRLNDLDSKTLESLMPVIKRSPKLAFQYVYFFTKKRTPELEPAIKQSAGSALQYARLFMDSRPWPEAEPAIMLDPVEAYEYAVYCIQDRWIEAEPYIMEDEYIWNLYKEYFEM